MENSRTKNSLLIMASGVGQKLVNILIGIVSRQIFIAYLGMAYVGINGLFTNVLSLLSLAELGIGGAITVYLYKPLAQKDEESIRSYMHFYKKCYGYIGAAVLAIGLAIVPFLPKLVRFDQAETPDVNLYVVYALFLANSVASYWFFAYKSSILNADQKGYIVNNLSTVLSAAASISKCVVVVLTRNFVLALATELSIGVVKNLLIARRADKLYPYLRRPGARPVEQTVLQRMFRDVRALFLSNVSFKLFSATDNLIISATLGTVLVGFADNYTMMINYVVMMIAMVTASLTAGIGNLNAKESPEKRMAVFRELDFSNFAVSCVASVCLYQLLTPCVQLLFGADKALGQGIVICLVLNFYMGTANNILSAFKTTMGLLRQGCYLALFGGALNIALTFYLAAHMGLVGVYLATILSEIFTTFFPVGWYAFRMGFEKPALPYLRTMALRMLLTVALAALVHGLCAWAGPVSLLGFIGQGVISVCVPVGVLWLIYHRRPEAQQVLQRLLGLVAKAQKKG